MTLRGHKRNGTKSDRLKTLQLCASYRERETDEWIKRMETVPEGSTDYVTYERTVKRFLLSKCVLAVSAS